MSKIVLTLYFNVHTSHNDFCLYPIPMLWNIDRESWAADLAHPKKYSRGALHECGTG